MGELLGIGLTHYPQVSYEDGAMAGGLRWNLDDPALPPEMRDPSSWPEGMRDEWGDDEGVAAAGRHRAAMLDGFRRLRRRIEDFSPDAIVVVGDDQYENFREDAVPPFAVLAYEDLAATPWAPTGHGPGPRSGTNVWGEPSDTTIKVRGARDIAKRLIEGLILRDIDMAYAYEPRHHPDLPHAFLNTVLFLDYDRTGFDHPIIPLAVNCYGRAVIGRRGGLVPLSTQPVLDPPSPTPGRCMAVGAALADVILESDLRICLIASSSWSHAFLCDKTWRLRPDTAPDRQLYEAMVAGRYDEWRAWTLEQIEESGQQELLNWFLLVGAMERTSAPLEWSTFIETYIFNSNKVFASFAVTG